MSFQDKNVTIRCYSELNDRNCFKFYPCKNLGEKTTLDYVYKQSSLTLFYNDFNKLLSDYFKEIYPTLDPTDNQFVESFDVCFDNWIGKNDWLKIISRIEEKLNSEILPKEKQFYSDFLKWLKTNIEWCDLIMVEGNL